MPWHDLLGLAEGLSPKFVRQYAELGSVIVDALTRFVADVRTGAFPSAEESYHVAADVVAAARERRASPDPPRAKE